MQVGFTHMLPFLSSVFCAPNCTWRKEIREIYLSQGIVIKEWLNAFCRSRVRTDWFARSEV